MSQFYIRSVRGCALAEYCRQVSLSQLHEEETNVLTRMTGPDQEWGAGGAEQRIEEEKEEEETA